MYAVVKIGSTIFRSECITARSVVWACSGCAVNTPATSSAAAIADASGLRIVAAAARRPFIDPTMPMVISNPLGKSA